MAIALMCSLPAASMDRMTGKRREILATAMRRYASASDR
jgi:hypothetical protein